MSETTEIPLVETFRGRSADLHSIESPVDGVRRLWHLIPSGPAVILGSTQPKTDVDLDAAASAGVEVVNRRSGGGAVWVDVDEPLWVDIWYPRDDPAWTDDVQRAFAPVGGAWKAALESLGVTGLTVHEGAMLCFTGSRQVCFAGVGPGEVIHETGKVVGISQRRTRHGARFQCALYMRWDPAPLHRLIEGPPSLEALQSRAVGLADLGHDNVSAADVISALTAQLT